METKTRDWSLDFIRILASFMVVLGHLTAENWFSFPTHSLTWTAINLLDSFVRPCISLFLMISGYLFLGRKKLDNKKLWKNTILHTLIVYIVWVLFYAIVYPGLKNSLSNLASIRENILGLHPASHLWYLRMIINVYVAVPLLWSLVRVMDKKLIRYLVAIFFIFGVMQSTIYSVSYYKSWIHQQIDLFRGMEFIQYKGYSDYNGMEFVGNTAYFMLGYLLADREVTKRISDRALLITYVLTVILAAAVNQFLSIRANEAIEAVYGTFTLPVFIETVCLFLLFRRRCETFNPSPKVGALLKNVSESTLFIYVFHLYAFKRLQILFHITTTSHNVIWWIPFLSICLYALCSLIGMVVKRIPVINKIII